MPEPSTTSSLAAPVLQWTWDNRDSIRKQLDKVLRLFRKKSKILILGPGGTGKSTFAQLMCHGQDWLTGSPWEYKPSIVMERVRFDDQRIARMVVLPGQKKNRDVDWMELRKEVIAGKFTGIMYFSSNGYHTPSEIDVKSLMKAKTKPEALSSFLAKNRDDELAFFREIAEAVRLARHRLWFCHVTTKEDLWVNESDSVRERWDCPEALAAVALMKQDKDPSYFRMESCFCSLLIANMVERSGMVLQKTTAGFDQQRQITSLRRLIEILHGLREWENQK